MDADQELVYGWMGLNPTLLLETKPAADNLMVLVVRPGTDEEAVLEEARQQFQAAGPRRRRGRGGSGGGGGSGRSANGYGADEAPASGSSPAPEPPREMTVEITPLPEFSEHETVLTVTVPTQDHPPEPSQPAPPPEVAPELAPEAE